uniref:Uncharacterized protein n=1 Tax=Timema genevievae TaxID=629358 RepID=A0A7R9PHY9_TIMGE|nr:unnamed protein product [Timema genevievae]
MFWIGRSAVSNYDGSTDGCIMYRCFDYIIYRNKHGKKKKFDKNLVDVKKKKRDAEMEHRNKIKNDPVCYEEFKRKERERYNKRKEDGKIKLISDLSERGKRQQRKKWVERTTRHRKRQKADREELNNILVCGTPSLSGTEAREVTVSVAGPSNGILGRAGSSRKNAGRKRVLRNRSQAHRKIKELEGKLKRLSKSAAKYKAKYYRLRKQKGNNESLQTRVREFLNGEKVSTKVVKRLQFGEVLTTITMQTKIQKLVRFLLEF